MRGAFAGLCVVAALAAPAVAHGQAASVAAEGNAFTGGLRFQPPDVAVGVGDVVRWTNADVLVPHTATEDHELWDLTGTYGQTPANPPGFGPGETRERPFEAGTHRYFCRVHPVQMRGSVAVPVRLAAAGTVLERKPSGRTRKRRRVLVTWAPAAPAAGLGFDVEIRRGDGEWRRWREGKRAASGTFRTQKAKAPWSVRARLRRLSDASA
ncbi:MAG: plastocyanin/azurin family copper-binding protein, partial [Actinomycetota bacterium]|nr:plastocyanin/azurin family copper-binding protein [Actinomycetota bacterium]